MRFVVYECGLYVQAYSVGKPGSLRRTMCVDYIPNKLKQKVKNISCLVVDVSIKHHGKRMQQKLFFLKFHTCQIKDEKAEFEG